MARVEAEWNAVLEQRLAPLSRPAERLVMILVACAEDSDSSLWIRLWRASLRDPAAAATRQRLDDHFREQVREVVAEGQREGAFEAALDPVEAAILLTAVVDGYAVQTTLHDATALPHFALEAFLDAASSLLGFDAPAVAAHLGEGDA